MVWRGNHHCWLLSHIPRSLSLLYENWNNQIIQSERVVFSFWEFKVIPVHLRIVCLLPVFRCVHFSSILLNDWSLGWWNDDEDDDVDEHVNWLKTRRDFSKGFWLHSGWCYLLSSYHQNFPHSLKSIKINKLLIMLLFLIYHRSIAFKFICIQTTTKEKEKITYSIHKSSNIWIGEKIFIPKIFITSWSWWDCSCFRIIKCSGWLFYILLTSCF